MLRKFLVMVSGIFFIASLNGCATGQKKADLESQGLRNQVSVLEAQLRSKDDEINSLRDALSKANQEKDEVSVTKTMGRKKNTLEAKSRFSIKHVQIALRNAGYEPGKIDGKIGRQTTEAIKAFQKTNNLPVDGKVGKNTWAVLKEYMYQKVK